MKPSMTLIAVSLAALLGASAALGAEEAEAPLAVTAAAAAGVSPSNADLLRSQRYLQDGLDALRADDAPRAVQALLDSVRLAPGADNYKALGTAYYQAGNRVKAGWACRESLKRRPDAKLQALAEQLQGAPTGGTATAAPSCGGAGGLTPVAGTLP